MIPGMAKRTEWIGKVISLTCHTGDNSSPSLGFSRRCNFRLDLLQLRLTFKQSEQKQGNCITDCIWMRANRNLPKALPLANPGAYLYTRLLSAVCFSLLQPGPKRMRQRKGLTKRETLTSTMGSSPVAKPIFSSAGVPVRKEDSKQ
jgi:hypothetical protein